MLGYPGPAIPPPFPPCLGLPSQEGLGVWKRRSNTPVPCKHFAPPPRPSQRLQGMVCLYGDSNVPGPPGTPRPPCGRPRV